MDSYQNFVETFKQAASAQNYIDLPSIFKEGEGSLAIVSLEHRESVVCSIFDRSDGLLVFLNYVLPNQGTLKNRHIDEALKEAFHFLNFFIENFYTTPCFIQYIYEIKNVCQLALTVKCGAYIQKAACNSFIKLIELFEDYDLKFAETIDKFIGIFKATEMRERRLIFCILGKIIKLNENVCSSQKCFNIFHQIYCDASKEYKCAVCKDTNVPLDFHIYFDVIADMLDSVELPNTLREKLLHEFYNWIKKFSQSDRQQKDKQPKKRVVMKSAINLLSRHMNLFQDLLYPDYKYWHDIFRSLSLETTVYGVCGQHALKRFYRIIGQILKNRFSQNAEESKIIIKYFLEYFQNIIDNIERFNTNVDFVIFRLAVYGFSHLTAARKEHFNNFDSRRTFSTISSYALPLCSSENSNSTQIENVSYCQEALSEILCHITDVTIEKLNVLVKLSIYTIKKFPDLTTVSNNTLVVSTLIKTIINLATINKSLLQQYLDSIVYDGVAWSCSHTLALDAELQRELNNLKQSPICYKNYLPLWTELLNAKRYRGQEQLAQYLASTMMNECITLINRLNIQVKRKNEDTVLSDVALTQSAVNQADFRVFTNLVDLYVDVIDASDLQLFTNTVHRFLYEVIRLSYRYPLISGFYKLIRAGMKIFAHILKEEEEKSAESRRMEELLSNYLWHTLDLIPTFSNELLIACLYLILNAPFVYIKDMLSRTLPAFKIAFTVGLSNLELAHTTLTALETWTTTAQKRNEQTNKLLREIIAYLEPYLRSTESSIEISQDLTTTRKRVKRVEVVDIECTLRNFQRRVLLFLGSLDHDLFTSFVHERASRSTGASWDRKDLFKYNLPLPDARPVIHFDRMLPRIIALARDSSDRRTKIAACEVLHSMVALFIGSTALRTTCDLDSGNSYVTLYGTLCRAVLALGCDPDEVVCRLFRPLALQLMHWLSSRHMSMSPVIDSLFDGLTDDSNPALREFSGMCLAEFTHWSIRQTSSNDSHASHGSHVSGIIGRITNLALHPSTRKRVAAAVAFNHLYVILREEDDTVSIYWLEIFYCFVCSLDGCDDPSLTNALAHIEKVIKFKVDLLNRDDICDRRKPYEFDNATLIHALYWLLSQCGTLDEYCRAKCMELYINISQYISSTQEITRNFVETYGIDRLNDIILKGLKSGVMNISMTNNVTSLLKALDYYVWLIDRELLSIEMLLPTAEAPIFLYICSFTHQFWRVIAESSAETVATTVKSTELEQLQTLQCKALMAILNFVQRLLNIEMDILLGSLWDEPLSALTIRCIMHPRTVGFDMKNIELTDKLPRILETLLNSMRSRYRYALPDIFEECLSNSIQEYIMNLLNLYDIAQNDSCDDLIQYVNGLILLKRCDMLDQMTLERTVFTNGENTIMQIFNFLVNKRIGELVCTDLSARMIEYLRTLMEFQFSLLSSTIERPMIIPDDTRAMTERLVKLIFDNTSVTSVDCTTIMHGEHFLNTFKSVIFKYMLTHVSVITHVFDVSRDKPFFLLNWTEDLLLFLKRHKRELQVNVDAIVNAILQQFTYLRDKTIFNIDSHKERLINIYSIVVHLKSKPTEIALNQEFYQWIRDQLTDNNDLEYKTQILKNFFLCLTDVTDREDLQISLRTLKTNSRSLCSDLSEISVNALKVINCFETLLMLLSTTRSMIMLKYVINFAAGTGKQLFDEKLEEHLRGYYYGASLEHVLESLQQTYHAFMEVNTVETERFDILHGFLLPAFKFCDATAIERFFETNIQNICATADLHITDSDDAIKQKIVSKIGCFQLIAIMFARVNENKIEANEKDKTMMQNVSDQILINREFYKRLFKICTEKTRSLRITRPECQELVRLLHCSAYNCSLAIVSLKKEERFYSTAFGEDNQKKFFIWENIIDCDTRYNLGQTFKEYPKTREITVNIKSAEVDRDRRRTHDGRYTYVHSYDLSTCTLSEDINDYDLNKCDVLPADFRRSASNSVDPLYSHGATSIALKNIDFNEHECMPYICVLLRHIRKTFELHYIRKPGIGLILEEPKWLELFLNVMQRDNQNIQLFMLKVISNTADEVFKSYAKIVLPKIVRAVANYLERYDLNYIITDVLEILMDWHDVPSNEDDRPEAQRLFEVFVEKVLTNKSDNNRVYNYNLSLMKIMVEKWRSCLRVPSELLRRKMISAPTAAVYFILVLLDNDMTEGIVARNDIVDFLLKSLSDWNTDQTPLECCRCLGLYLRSLDNSGLDETERESKKCEVKQRIFAILGSILSLANYMSKQVKRVAVLCRTYPEVAMDYITVTINTMAKSLTRDSSCRSYCLDIFALAMPRLNAQDIVSNLLHMKLDKILKNRMLSCEMALQIVRDMVAIVSPMDLLPYVNLAIPYIKDSSTVHRELVYDMLMKIHKRFSADIVDDDATVQNLLSISVQHLLAGLLDPSSDLQDRILKFWTEETSLSTESSKARLVALLAMHSSRMTTEKDPFALFVALLMLQLTTKSINYTRKMFDAPLQDSCTFENYKITISCRRRNLSCMTPMFVDSLASQMSYSTFSQSLDNETYMLSYQRPSHGVPLGLRATQDLQFEPTLDDDDPTTLDTSSHDTEFDRTTIASTSREPQHATTSHERFTRILANPSNFIRDQQIRKNMQRAEKIKQESIRQRSNVKLYRKYRIGDFPDIEISHASLIVPLQQLIKLDQLICKDMTVALIYSLIEETVEMEKSDDFRRTIVENLKRILHDSCERDSFFNAVILETLLQLSRDAATIANCDPRDIVKASKANHLNALGTLLLERSLLPDALDDDSPTSSKRMRRNDDDIRNEETSKWAQLASLYKSLNDADVVLSIFRGRQSFGQNVQEAALAEVDGNWIRAKDAFTNAYKETEDLSIKEHCLQGLIETVNNLCDWSAIDRLVKNRAENRNLKNIWNDTWRDWMIPYACDAYVHMSESASSTSYKDEVEIIQSWTYDRDKLQYLMPTTGDNLVMFLLKNDVKKANDLLNDLLDMTGKQWVGLSPLCTELGIRKLFKLQIMNDLDTSLKILRCANNGQEFKNRMPTLFNFWSMKAPTIRDNLIQWNKLAAYRAYSSTLFQKICRKVKGGSAIKRQLYQNNYQLRLGIVDAALNQKHQYIAEKHLADAIKYLNYINEMDCEEYVRHLKVSSTWLKARLKSLCADVETNMFKKMFNYTASWELLHELLSSDELDADMSTAIKEHIGMTASKIESLSREDDAFASTLPCNTTILKDIGMENLTNIDLENIQKQLLSYSLNNLQSCCKEATATSLGKHYCALAKYFYGRLMSIDAESDDIFQKFLSSILESMRHDYLEATHYFPCLLNPERLRHNETREMFVRECAKLRPWLFLRWRDLLFSHLGTSSIATAIIPIIERLAETYPDAIAYTYHLAVERNPGILQDEKFQRMRSLLSNKAEEYGRFLQAIQYVAQPKLFLKHYLDEAMRDLSRGKATAIESLLRKVYPDSSMAEGPRPGHIFQEITNYENTIRETLNSNRDAAPEELRRLKESLNESIQKNVRSLKDYSPFLHEYIGGSGSGIEIPGQYIGDREPMPRYHVRIARFEPQVVVMQSLRKPIRIGMVGDNGREYKFLVKFGEDLTIDQGLQQLYSTMNRTLRNDPGCSQRRLAIDTYEVIPLSSSFGLIQWIENTRSLEDLVKFTLSKKSDWRMRRIREKYAKWIQKAAPMEQRSVQYKVAVSKYSQQAVTENMKRLIGETKQTALRDAFDAISPSPECFVTLRRNFVASYATMCAAHWLAGVGDRHLQNILVHVATGRCLGIDFGHAFGSGIRASIPELVPFRLTPQILELLRPFTERDLLATIMTHTMRALRDDQGPILACMDIFVHKPIQRSLSINDDEDIDADLTWSSKRNIEIVAKKLNGIHPSIITLEQLQEAHNDQFARYNAIITGNDEHKQTRADIRNDHLTPVEQVDCLLDQAKDLNVLGRMYVYWQPWL